MMELKGIIQLLHTYYIVSEYFQLPFPPKSNKCTAHLLWGVVHRGINFRGM